MAFMDKCASTNNLLPASRKKQLAATIKNLLRLRKHFLIGWFNAKVFFQPFEIEPLEVIGITTLEWNDFDWQGCFHRNPSYAIAVSL